MKGLKKTVGILCVVSLLMGGCASKGDNINQKTKQETIQQQKDNYNQTGLPIVNEKVTLKVLGIDDGDQDPAEVIMLKELEERTNVHIEWDIVLKDAWKDKKGLLFASGDLPDIFLGNKVLEEENLLTYGTQGLLIPMEDLIKDHSEYLSKIFSDHPDYKKAITAPDGHIYGAPSIDAGFPITTEFPLFMNVDWLKAVGMDAPTTTEEFYQVLKAFKENDVNGNGDPNDEIPFTSYETLRYVSDLFGAFGIIDDYKTHISVENDKIIFTATDDRYKEAIKYFHKLYSEELIDQELFTQDKNVFTGKTKAPDKRIVGAFQQWRSTGYKRNDNDVDYNAIAPLKGPNGDKLWPERLVGIFAKGEAAITNQCEYPEIAMRWIDQWYETEFAIQESFKLFEGIHIEKQADGKYVNIKERTPEEGKMYFPDNGFRIYNLTPESGSLLAERPAHVIEKQELDLLYKDFYPQQTLPMLFFTLEENDKLIELKADIITYVNEMYARWIISGGIDDDWDEYKEKVNKMGMDEYMKIYQDAFERYNQ